MTERFVGDDDVRVAELGVARLRTALEETVLQGGLAAALAGVLLTFLTGFLQGRVPEVVALSIPALFSFFPLGIPAIILTIMAEKEFSSGPDAGVDVPAIPQ